MPDFPAKADFAIEIDFDRGAARPQRVFQTADALITAFQHFDRTLVQSVDSNIEPVLVLEDIEVGSLKILLRNILNIVDDQALKDLDWRPQIGKYLVKAKYVMVDFLDRRIELDDDRKRLAALRNDLALLAQETDARHLPDYPAVPASDLISCATKIAEAKAVLSKNDQLSIISAEGKRTFDLSTEWAPDTMQELFVKETVRRPAYESILLVKRPDYIGQSKWDFRHAKSPLSASMQDEEWLARFQSRQIDVRPGDALRCSVEQEVKYGYDNEVIAETYAITKVMEVLDNRLEQPSMFASERPAKTDDAAEAAAPEKPSD